MRTNILESNKHDDITKLLDDIKYRIEEAIKLSLDKIKDNPQEEDEIFKIWVDYSNDVVECFNNQAEKTNNQRIVKKIIKYAMFKK